MTTDPRHSKRIETIQLLFAATYSDTQNLSEQAKEVFENTDKIDPYIEKTAPDWPIMKLNKIDLCILRLAVFELLIKKTEPVKVIVDEAVELAKELGSENSPSFVNGVLGTIIEENKLEEEKTK